MGGKLPRTGALNERLSEIGKGHILVTHFPVEEGGGVESIVMESDFPDAAGLQRPRGFARQLTTLSEATVKRIMCGNGCALLPLGAA
jgi:hypothetical protein